MKLCIPVDSDDGLDSPVSGHFGSAPTFIIVDTASRDLRAVPNLKMEHDHGHCSPLESLEGQDIDYVAVGGIGRGALGKLESAGIHVVRTPASTVRETVQAFAAGSLEPVAPDAACSSHGHHHTP